MRRMLALFTVLSLSMTTLLQAEVLEMPPARETTAGYTVNLPGRGMNMTQVEERFGSPLQKLPEVGDPPIIRWIYPDYTVYFEYQYVINSVLNVLPSVPAAPPVQEAPAAEPMAPVEMPPPAEVLIPPPSEDPVEFTPGVEIIGESPEAETAEPGESRPENP